MEVRDWKVPVGKQTDGTALPGAAFIEVRSGRGSLQAGKEEQRVTNDFWTVPENAKMSVEAAGEAAVLEVVSFNVR